MILKESAFSASQCIANCIYKSKQNKSYVPYCIATSFSHFKNIIRETLVFIKHLIFLDLPYTKTEVKENLHATKCVVL